ncbi:hypothetical protein NIES4102_10090 [Chondrocystis sp. NIES-4102]|nr:hypothetical protein NIES4102_10090 [Chondrocystis sp. NIES-4102]
MRQFLFYAMGDEFDVAQYLSQYQIDYSCVWERDKHQTNGLVKYLGNEYMLNIYEQEKIAYKYMQTNKDALKALVNFAMLSLSCEFEIDSETTRSYLSFEPETMLLAGHIGLKLAFNLEISISETWYIPSAAEY